MTKEKILITSALLYANGKIHFGHLAGAYLPAECYARFQRLIGNDVLYISGSDEYGVAILLSAQLAGRTPREQVDLFHQKNKEIFERLNFSFDHYSRTTWEGHQETVSQYFTDLYQNGLITSEFTEQLYSESENQFLADRYVMGNCPKCNYYPARGDECPSCAASYEAIDLKNPLSKISQQKLIRRTTKHWFLRLDLMKDKLHDWLLTRRWKSNVFRFTDNYISDLRPRAITRDLSWGTAIPLDPSEGTEGKVLYVWFDAPIGYISAAKEWAQLHNKGDAWKSFWCEPSTRLVHFIGKDNIPFHGVIFPAMTLGQSQPYKLVDDLPANEFYLLEGRQFSKSDGWYIDIEEFLDLYTADQLRYMIAATAPENSDSEFTWKEFQQKCNSDLLGKFGNFANRMLTFAANNCGQRVPPLTSDSQIEEFLAQADALMIQIYEAYSNYHLRRATQILMELAQIGNAFFDHRRPWEAKKAAKKELEENLPPTKQLEMESTIAACMRVLSLMALAASPIIPTIAQTLWSLLGFTTTLEKEVWSSVLSTPIEVGTLLPPPVLLTRKVEDEEIAQHLAKLYAFQTTSKKETNSMNPPDSTPETASLLPIAPFKPTITFDQFEQVDLRVGKILAAEILPKSKKLLKLQVDIGGERGGDVRTILSGIRLHYQPEDLIGKNAVVVANLATATIMGVESQGMLLAAGDGDLFELLNLNNIPAGSVIK